MIDRYRTAAATLKLATSPLRLAILRAIQDGHESPYEVFLTLRNADPRLNLSLVSYHVTLLREGDMIELVGLVKVRGVQKHEYKVTPLGASLLQLVDVL